MQSQFDLKSNIEGAFIYLLARAIGSVELDDIESKRMEQEHKGSLYEAVLNQIVIY